MPQVAEKPPLGNADGACRPPLLYQELMAASALLRSEYR